MVNAEKQGRNLVLALEGVDPFVIKPLPGHAGRQITGTYLASLGRKVPAQEMAGALQMAVDGAVLDGDVWVPVPDAEQTNYNRLGMELSQTEAELILMPAFFWQTILGMDGVRAYLEGGEGNTGTLKAMGALHARLGTLARQISPSSV